MEAGTEDAYRWLYFIMTTFWLVHQFNILGCHLNPRVKGKAQDSQGAKDVLTLHPCCNQLSREQKGTKGRKLNLPQKWLLALQQQGWPQEGLQVLLEWGVSFSPAAGAALATSRGLKNRLWGYALSSKERMKEVDNLESMKEEWVWIMTNGQSAPQQ